MVRDAELKFTREFPGTVTIHSVDANGVRIRDKVWKKTIAVTTDAVLDDWEAPAVDALRADHFEALLAHDPELVILGCGRSQIFPPRELTFAFARRGVGLDVMDTRAAARTFNVLAGEGRKVAAVLYELSDNH